MDEQPKPIGEEEEKKKKKKRFLLILLIVLILIAVASATLLFLHLFPFGQTPAASSAPIPSRPASTESELPRVENPIDFAAKRAEMPDIVGWIRIPDTVIDYPVMQSTEEEVEDFYLHRAPNKQYLFAGSIYMQKMNSADFGNPNTVLYGHNMADGSMFAFIRWYWGEEYFDAHPNVYVYTPGHILTYRVYAAFAYDDRHILNSFNFYNDKEYGEYLAMTKDPPAMLRQVRPEIPVTTEDKILTLSTCTGYPHQRFLVEGVLIDDQLTY